MRCYIFHDIECKIWSGTKRDKFETLFTQCWNIEILWEANKSSNGCRIYSWNNQIAFIDHLIIFISVHLLCFYSTFWKQSNVNPNASILQCSLLESVPAGSLIRTNGFRIYSFDSESKHSSWTTRLVCIIMESVMEESDPSQLLQKAKSEEKAAAEILEHQMKI